jgi:hypothetical protein
MRAAANAPVASTSRLAPSTAAAGRPRRRAAAAAAAAAEEGGATSAASASTAQVTVALKEWSVACSALGRGQQTVLFRKGGIKEPTFKPEVSRFFLFPTAFHTEASLLQPGLAEAYAQVCTGPAAAGCLVATSRSRLISGPTFTRCTKCLAPPIENACAPDPAAHRPCRPPAWPRRRSCSTSPGSSSSCPSPTLPS